MNRVACHWQGGKGSESNMLGWIFLKLECRRRQAQFPNIEKNNVTVIAMLHKRCKLIFWAPGPVDIRVAKYIRQIQGFYKKNYSTRQLGGQLHLHYTAHRHFWVNLKDIRRVLVQMGDFNNAGTSPEFFPMPHPILGRDPSHPLRFQ